MTIGALRIQTPVGVVEIGDTVTVDLSTDPVARAYGWPNEVTGKAVSAHADHLIVYPEGAYASLALMGFALLLSADNAGQVTKVVKASGDHMEEVQARQSRGAT
mgnify:FL=1